MKVQKSEAGGWTDVETVVDDTSPRNILSGSYLNLSSIWNPAGWDTDKRDPGTYRVFAALRDGSGNILENDDNSLMTGYYQFNLTSPPSMIEIENIKIYDVTNAANNHTDTTNLTGSGTNTTFNLYTGKLYRIEFWVKNNDSSEANWTISSSDDIFHEYLNSTWAIDNNTDMWFANDTTNNTGGSWSGGKVDWDTSQGMNVTIGNYVKFYYVFNITTAANENYQVHFMINNTYFTEEDYSTFKIILSESQPPQLYNNIYNITPTQVDRGQSALVYARWNEEISEAKTEYNSTSSTLQNHTISLPDPNPQNWTNHTISTNSGWTTGVHKVKIYAADMNSNWNNTLSYLDLDVYGLASVVDSNLTNDTIDSGGWTIMQCRVQADNSSYIESYNVTFYNSTDYLGYNTTNATGWAQFNFTDNSLGYETITCNITDDTTKFLHASSQHQKQETLHTIEHESPKYYNVSPSLSMQHKGYNITYRSNWTDNFELDYAWLETNETGQWKNNSLHNPIKLTGDEDWANFTVTLPQNMTPGIMGWRIWANDTSGNINKTDVNTTEVRAWIGVADSDLTPSTIFNNSWSVMYCQVQEANTSGIDNYNVTFYSNESGYMGWNTTNATGWAQFNFTDNTTGLEEITCNITDDLSRYLEVAPGYENRTETLDTRVPGADVTPPGLVDNTYGLNTTWVWKGGSVLAYAHWNETIYDAYIKYNSTSSSFKSHQISGLPSNWTNYTISTNSSWIVGNHSVKINASDFDNNWNNSLEYKHFIVWGRSEVVWLSPSATVYRQTTALSCNVTDKDSGEPIQGVTVKFYNGSWEYLGSNDSDATGKAEINYDFSSYAVGPQTLHCVIENEPSLYYNTSSGDDTGNGPITVKGLLNVSIDNPAPGTDVRKGEIIWLNSSTKDEFDQSVSVNATWRNTTTELATTEDYNWTIPVGHSVGPELITINVSKQYYDPDSKNVSVNVWGWSNITWDSPASGNYTQETVLNLTCLVLDANTSSGIESYNVTFYNNDTGYMGYNTTNSTGYFCLL